MDWYNREMNKIVFRIPVKEAIYNFKTGEECFLVSNEDEGNFSEADLLKITEICNQPAVYDFLFKEKLGNEPYELEKAKKFAKWVVEGWQKQEWFVFLIRRNEGEIVGAIDIKSNDLEMAEVGYWADENFAGIMTNATGKIVELAKKAGYKKLFATTKPNNERSQKVLSRNHFLRQGEMIKLGGKRFKFIRQL